MDDCINHCRFLPRKNRGKIQRNELLEQKKKEKCRDYLWQLYVVTWSFLDFSIVAFFKFQWPSQNHQNTWEIKYYCKGVNFSKFVNLKISVQLHSLQEGSLVNMLTTMHVMHNNDNDNNKSYYYASHAWQTCVLHNRLLPGYTLFSIFKINSVFFNYLFFFIHLSLYLNYIRWLWYIIYGCCATVIAPTLISFCECNCPSVYHNFLCHLYDE